ncbi:AraC family transcriptional regulator [Nocardia sp. X0981]
MFAKSDVPSALSAHPAFVGRDIDRARATTSRVVDPHGVRVIGPRDQARVRLFAAQISTVTLAYLDWGTEVEITAPDVSNCYCLHLPVRGKARVESGDQRIVASAARAALTTPEDSLRMMWAPDTAQMILRVERSAIDEGLRELLGRPLRRGPIRMPLGIDLSGVTGVRWKSVLELVTAEIVMRDSLELHGGPTGGASAAAINDLVVNALLLWHPHNYTDLLTAAAAPARAPHIRQVVDYILQHLDEPLQIGALATQHNVSIRALQAGFIRDLGCTPTEFIRNQRLERIHQELSKASPVEGVSVSEVAQRWGFSHLGRLSQVYRARYGELPSRTLREL